MDRRAFIAEERNRYRHAIRTKNKKGKVVGKACSICDRKGKAQQVSLCGDTLRFLVVLVAMWEKEPRWYFAGEVFHGVKDWSVRFYRIKKKERNPPTDALFLKWWPRGPLIKHWRAKKEDDEELEETSDQKFDLYQPTQRGIHFVKGITKAVFSCWFYQKKLLHREEPVVWIGDPLVGDMNVQQVMEVARRSFDDLKP